MEPDPSPRSFLPPHELFSHPPALSFSFSLQEETR
jgi:hypothetical protein